MNATKRNPLKRDRPKFTKSVNNGTLHDQCTPDCQSQKNSRSRFLRLVLWLNAKRHTVQHNCLKGQTGTCSLGTTFSPVHRPWQSQCTALQTDRQTGDMMMPIADHIEYQYDRLKMFLGHKLELLSI